MNRNEWIEEIVRRLDRFESVPTDVLADIVIAHGACAWCYDEGEPPDFSDYEDPDRALAECICAGCPVQDQCLELELRLAGSATLGVWGTLSDRDRRAVYPLWRAHRDDRSDPGGGEPS